VYSGSSLIFLLTASVFTVGVVIRSSHYVELGSAVFYRCYRLFELYKNFLSSTMIDA